MLGHMGLQLQSRNIFLKTIGVRILVVNSSLEGAWLVGRNDVHTSLKSERARTTMGNVEKAASGVPCLCWSGFAQAGRHCAVHTYWEYAPHV